MLLKIRKKLAKTVRIPSLAILSTSAKWQTLVPTPKEKLKLLNYQDMHTRKGLKKCQDILDFMGNTELAANLFHATQTDEKLRRKNYYRCRSR